MLGIIILIVLIMCIEYIIIYYTSIYTTKNKYNTVKKDIVTTINNLEVTISRTTSGNISHKKGTILNSCNHIKFILNS